MTRDELGKSIYNCAHLTGDFLLRSGQRSTEYFDKYQFESDPKILKAIGEQLKDKIPAGTEVLGALEMGGIPIATAISFATGIPVVFVRKEAKSYGTCKFAEGPDVSGKKLCIVEDVITTGGQVKISTADLRKEGALISDVVCVIDRSNGDSPKITESDLKLHSLFTMNELKALIS